MQSAECRVQKSALLTHHSSLITSRSAFPKSALFTPHSSLLTSLAAFTLLEMLTVIAIIGIVAAMVLGLTRIAGSKRKAAVASAEVNKLTIIIDNYQAKMGFYPPDNVTNSQLAFGDANYENSSAVNPLLYELTGASRDLSQSNAINFMAYTGTNALSTPGANFSAVFGRGGVANSDPTEARGFFKPLPKSTEFVAYPGATAASGSGVVPAGLIVPLDTPAFGYASGSHLNFVHYDSTSTNRHNQNSYDVWVEYLSGNDSHGNALIITNGNWK